MKQFKDENEAIQITEKERVCLCSHLTKNCVYYEPVETEDKALELSFKSTVNILKYMSKIDNIVDLLTDALFIPLRLDIDAVLDIFSYDMEGNKSMQFVDLACAYYAMYLRKRGFSLCEIYGKFKPDMSHRITDYIIDIILLDVKMKFFS